MKVQGFWAETVTGLMKIVNQWLEAHPGAIIITVSQSQDPGNDDHPPQIVVIVWYFEATQKMGTYVEVPQHIRDMIKVKGKS